MSKVQLTRYLLFRLKFSFVFREYGYIYAVLILCGALWCRSWYTDGKAFHKNIVKKERERKEEGKTRNR